MKKFFCLMALAMTATAGFAQDDFGTILSLEAEKKISKKFSVGLEAEMRTRDDVKSIDRWSGGFQAGYKLLPWLKVLAGYTYLYEGYGIEQFNFTESTLKLFVDQMKQLDGKIKTTSHIFCMPIPTRISYFQSEIPVQVRREDNFFNSSQEDYLNALKNELPDRMKLIKLNDVFQFAYEQGNDPYFKSDKNWMPVYFKN